MIHAFEFQDNVKRNRWVWSCRGLKTQWMWLGSKSSCECLWHRQNEISLPSPHLARNTQQSIAKKIWIIPAQWLQNINNIEMVPGERKLPKGEREGNANDMHSKRLLVISSPSSVIIQHFHASLFHLCKRPKCKKKKSTKINSSKFPADKIMKIEKESDTTDDDDNGRQNQQQQHRKHKHKHKNMNMKCYMWLHKEQKSWGWLGEHQNYLSSRLGCRNSASYYKSQCNCDTRVREWVRMKLQFNNSL